MHLESGTFRQQPTTNKRGGSRSLVAQYIKVKAGAFFAWQKEFYLHTLMCSMYRGPSPASSPQAGHMCEHTCCICPWHIRWMSVKTNAIRHHKHMKQDLK